MLCSLSVLFRAYFFFASLAVVWSRLSPIDDAYCRNNQWNSEHKTTSPASAYQELRRRLDTEVTNYAEIKPEVAERPTRGEQTASDPPASRDVRLNRQ
jgi:hypothetical protein